MRGLDQRNQTDQIDQTDQTAGSKRDPVLNKRIWSRASKLRLKYGPISVGETKLHRATRRLCAGLRNSADDKRRKRARGKLEKVVSQVPGSLVAALAAGELPRLLAEDGMYR